MLRDQLYNVMQSIKSSRHNPVILIPYHTATNSGQRTPCFRFISVLASGLEGPLATTGPFLVFLRAGTTGRFVTERIGFVEILSAMMTISGSSSPSWRWFWTFRRRILKTFFLRPRRYRQISWRVWHGKVFSSLYLRARQESTHVEYLTVPLTYKYSTNRRKFCQAQTL